MTRENGLLIIAWIIFIIVIVSIWAYPASAERLDECPGMAVEMRDLPDEYSVTMFYPHVWQWARWVEQPEGAQFDGLGTDTLTITGAQDGVLHAGTVCQWRVFIPVVIR